MMTDIVNYLTSQVFYLAEDSKSEVPGLVKIDLLRFNEDGEITGVSNRSHYWKVQENELLLLDQREQEIVRFTTYEETLIESSAKTGKKLLPAGFTEIESLATKDGPDKKSMLSFVNKNSVDYQQLKEAAAADKTIDGYAEGNYFLVSRKSLKLGFLRDEEFGIDYLLELPIHPESTAAKKLVIELHWLEHGDVSAYVRMYGNSRRPRDFQTSLAPNTYVLRVADSNLISGSYFFNTPNYLDYEENLQSFFKKIAGSNEIPLENIVFYGFSRGGTASLYHAALGNYACVSVDPVVDRSPWLKNNQDLHLVFDFLPLSFLEKLSAALSQTSSEAKQLQIICSENSSAVFPEILKLDLSKVRLSNLKMALHKGNPIGNHGQLFAKTFPLQIALLNNFLYKL
jgi:hypothetical protein